MNQSLLHHVALGSLRTETPQIEAGMSVKVSQKIREGEKERIQNFEGLVIATNGGKGVNATFTVRKIVGGIGVEKVFPLHGKNIVKIEIIKEAKIRRSKLYHMRELRGKAARMSETHVRSVVLDDTESKKKKESEEKSEKKTDVSPDVNSTKQDDKKVEEKPAEKVEVEKTEKPEVEKKEDVADVAKEPEEKIKADEEAEKKD